MSKQCTGREPDTGCKFLGTHIRFCPMHKAAPDMLAALEAVSGKLPCSYGFDGCLHCQVDIAIAAAKGSEHAEQDNSSDSGPAAGWMYGQP